MKPRMDQDTVAAMAKKALVMMAKWKIPLCPENYLVWIGHIIGVDELLDEDINRIVREGGQFSEEINLDLFQRHFGKDARLKLVQDAQEEVQKILKDTLENILQTKDFTSEYRDQLKGFTAQLNEARGLDEIKNVVADLMLVTVAAIQTSEQLKEHITETTIKSENLQKELEKAQQEILIDPLTLLNNRKAFDKNIATYLKIFQDEGIGFSAVMIDIDLFKNFNDIHGHLLGDQVLKFMGSLLSKELKGKDFVARYGGEEFIILLSGTSLKKACLVANNIRKSLDGVQLKYVKTGQVLGKITISAGVSAVRKGDTERSLVKRADDALYLAKHSGRNTIKSEEDLSNHYDKPEAVVPSTVDFLIQ
jgi:diguanylate cyclase